MNSELIRFSPLRTPTPEIAEAFTRWENDPDLVPLTRPLRNQQELETRHRVTPDTLLQRLKHDHIYLLYLGAQLIGEMNYQVDPAHLLRKKQRTAWLSIMIGEAQGRGRGIGYQALQYLERQITAKGIGRVELGVFEFNIPAIALYRKAGYQEIGRIADFTYWQGRMWQDIRMEKILNAANVNKGAAT